MSEDHSIIIIGAGFAGMAAGIYAQMNGYSTRIYELHDQPGGLCTAWKRKGYTIDGCIHWLVGSSPQNGMNRFWQEVGVAQGRQIIDLDEFARFEGQDGRTVIFYSDLERLEQHLLQLSPQDAKPIHEFIAGARLGVRFNPPSGEGPLLKRLWESVRFLWVLLPNMRRFQKWMKTSIQDFANQFKDPLLRAAFIEMWYPDFGVLFLMFTMSYLHTRNAGYPIGGSLPMSRAMESRYLALGGQMHYKSRVVKVLVEDGRAVGVRLADGSEPRAGRVISAADGHATIFDMLEGRFADDTIRGYYEKYPIFPPLIFVGLGVNRSFASACRCTSSTRMPPWRRPARPRWW
jgi:phytoene dehydrogenase-like protein